MPATIAILIPLLRHFGAPLGSAVLANGLMSLLRRRLRARIDASTRLGRTLQTALRSRITALLISAIVAVLASAIAAYLAGDDIVLAADGALAASLYSAVHHYIRAEAERQRPALPPEGVMPDG